MWHSLRFETFYNDTRGFGRKDQIRFTVCVQALVMTIVMRGGSGVPMFDTGQSGIMVSVSTASH